jgi:hypothetical protein
MARTSKQGQWTTVGHVLLACSIYGAYELTTYVHNEITNLPVKRPPAVNHEVKPLTKETLFPVMVKYDRSRSTTGGGSQIESLFREPEPEAEKAKAAAEIKLPPVDYAAVVKGQLTVNAVANNGAIVNDTFVRVGEPLHAASFTDGKAMIVPVLASVSGDTATVQAGKRMVPIKVKSADY